jgi:outer membrane protein OmpA-like peptidoglycan-associated protein
MKKFILFFFVTLIGTVSYIKAQTSEKLKQVFLDGEYFYLYEDYEEALYSYNTLYRRGYTDNGNINYRIGQCYINIPGEKIKAISFLEKATKRANSSYKEGSFKETNAPFDAWYYLGIAYRINGQLDKAISSFEKYKELLGAKNEKATHLADKEIASCNYAKLAMKNPQKVIFSNLGRPISTNSRDFFPAVSGDESMIVYNSAQKFYTAIYFSKKVKNKWSAPVNITPDVQSDGNQYVSSISYDGTELYLRLEENFQADIYMSKYENGRWTKSRAVKNINTKYFEGNASVSKDGQTLYFSSNRTGGFGAMDIYKSVKLPNGNWGPAENLGNVINTELNEDAPFISDDGTKLFFVSQAHNTLGGFDVFYSVLGSDGKWGQPINMGYPVNNTDDNIFFQPIHDGLTGYTSLYALNSLGKEDIFKVNIGPAPATEIAQYADSAAIADSLKLLAIQNTKALEKEREIPADVVKALTEPVITEKDKERIVLRTLFFDFNSFLLTPESKKELDHLAMVLSNYPELKIELIGATDAVGSIAYNQRLSLRRALSAKKYLLSKGISAKRLLVKGVGKNNFVAINNNPDGSDNPDGRKYNRRVDIHLQNIQLKNIIIETVIDVPDNLKIK